MSIAFEPELEENALSDTLACTSVSDAVLLRIPADLKLTVTAHQFELLAGLNPELRLEMSASGELIAMAPEGSWSGHLNYEILIEFGQWIRLHGGLGFGSSAGFLLPNGACRSPDFSWISAARWNALPDADKSGFARICPDFVVELRSPTDSIDQLKSKMEEYRDNGTLLGWLIDPIAKTVTIYRPRDEPLTRTNPETISGEDVLPGFTLNLTPIFSPKH